MKIPASEPGRHAPDEPRAAAEGNRGDNAPILEVTDLKTWFPIRRGVFSRTVGHVRAVDGVSFTVASGETLGLVGESGCGKTTLGRTLMGLEKATSGQALFQGRDLARLEAAERRDLYQRMQIIFQDPLSSLNPRMNVLDIVTEGLVRFGMPGREREARARALMAEVGLDGEAVYRYPHEFSGGQRQRINIARAVSLRPDFIVCDEPVSALDVSVQAQVINLLKDLRRTHGLSYLFISHDLSVVANIAHRVAVMYLGDIMEVGPTADIIRDPLHPYTKTLIAAVPEPGGRRIGDKSGAAIKNGDGTVIGAALGGEPPSSVAPPAGCRFHPRCAEATTLCSQKAPKVVASGQRWVKCHQWGKNGTTSPHG